MDNIEIIETVSTEKPKVVALAMSERLRQLIRQEAFEREMSFSAMTRYILEKYFRESKQEIDC